MYVVVYFKSVDKTPSGYHPNENQFSSTNALKEKIGSSHSWGFKGFENYDKGGQRWQYAYVWILIYIIKQ